MMEQLNRVQANILGVVVNRIPHHGAEYYGGYQYYSPYYSNGYYKSKENTNQEEHKSLLRWLKAENGKKRIDKDNDEKPNLIEIEDRKLDDLIDDEN